MVAETTSSLNIASLFIHAFKTISPPSFEGPPISTLSSVLPFGIVVEPLSFSRYLAAFS